ncbi:MAG: type II toxin-antitoxin system HicB family antitoxin [Myxococcaceae bacterium]|nr:type II toxin-antitoxin system HicB family antitoxin [Myxococcaceae bacterium]MCI0670862.1 type II toxin-antitoxin system HicB family antitoxin [Myxococcaceae bacterium]
MRYAAVVSKEGKATLAEFPDAPGCQTFAQPGEDIAELAQEALEGWLEAHLVTGDVPPPPPKRAPRVGKGESVLWVDIAAKLALQVELRRARHEAGLTQSALAKRAGVSQQAIAKLENPDANPTIDTLEKVAKALGARLRVAVETPREKPAARVTYGTARRAAG